MRWLLIPAFNIESESAQTAVLRFLDSQYIGVFETKLPQRGMNHLSWNTQVKESRQQHVSCQPR